MATEENDDNWEIYKSMFDTTSSLLNNQFLADIKFQLEDQSIYAHSHELSKRSKVFARQYQGTVGVMKLIVIPNQPYAVFYEFLKYIYTDACDITNTNVLGLLKLSLKYEITGLTTVIRKFLMVNLACDNVLKLYEFCLEENFMPQISKISIFISENFYVLIKSNLLLDVSLLTLTELLKLDKIDNVTRENDVCNSVMRWVNNYCIRNGLPLDNFTKRGVLKDVLKLIRFPAMSNEEFSRFVQVHTNILTLEEISSIYITNSLQERNTYGFTRIPRTIFINYSAGPEVILNLRPYFGYENKLPLGLTDCGFSVSQNIIVTSIEIGDSLVLQTIEVKLLNETKQVLRYKKIEYNFNDFPLGMGSVQVIFDLPFLLKPSHKYYLSLKYFKPVCPVKAIIEKKLSKEHKTSNQVEIKFDEISPFLFQLNFREFK